MPQTFEPDAADGDDWRVIAQAESVISGREQVPIETARNRLRTDAALFGVQLVELARDVMAAVATARGHDR